jgi:hypothetical protein
VRVAIGPIATPDFIVYSDLPKVSTNCIICLIQFTSHFETPLTLTTFYGQQTRSGKILRRVLRKIAGGEESELGDTSALADPSVSSTVTYSTLLQLLSQVLFKFHLVSNSNIVYRDISTQLRQVVPRLVEKFKELTKK